MSRMKQWIPLAMIASALLLRLAHAEPLATPVVLGDVLQITVFAGGEKSRSGE